MHHPAEPLRVLVVHGEPVVRDAIARRLADQPDLSVCSRVGTVSGALDALRRVEHDVVTSASALPDGSGADVVEFVQASERSTATVLLVDPDDPLAIADAIRSGADGVTTTDRLDAGLLRSVRSVPRGACVLGSRAASDLAAVCPPQVAQLLSSRELEVLGCLALGLTNAQTAARLYVSRETVKTHVARVLRKLEVSDRRAAAERAVLLGLLPRGAADRSAHLLASGAGDRTVDR